MRSNREFRLATEQLVEKALTLRGEQRLDGGMVVRIKPAWRSKWEPKGENNPRYDRATQVMRSSGSNMNESSKVAGFRSVPPAKIQEHGFQQSAKPSSLRSRQALKQDGDAVAQSSDVSVRSVQPSIGTKDRADQDVRPLNETSEAHGQEERDDNHDMSKSCDAGKDDLTEQSKLLPVRCADAHEPVESSVSTEKSVQPVTETQLVGSEGSSRPLETADAKYTSTEDALPEPTSADAKPPSADPKPAERSRETSSEDSVVIFTPSSRTISPASPRPAIAGRNVSPPEGDKSTPEPTQHKRTASLFSEAEIAERKKAWNKIAMPQNLLLRKKPTTPTKATSKL